jgi:hypothetical protein
MIRRGCMGRHARLPATSAVRKCYTGALEASPRLEETYIEYAVIVRLDQKHSFGQVDLWRPYPCVVQSIAFVQTRPRPVQ